MMEVGGNLLGLSGFEFCWVIVFFPGFIELCEGVNVFVVCGVGGN